MKKLFLILLISLNSIASLEECDFKPTSKVPLIKLCESIEIDKIDKPVSRPSSENICTSKDFRFFMGTAAVSIVYGALMGGWIGSHWYAHCE